MLGDNEYYTTNLEPISWLPIKTAKRDGTRYLLYGVDSDDEGTACYWMATGFYSPVGDGWRGVSHPTHYMPLPVPPESGEGL